MDTDTSFMNTLAKALGLPENTDGETLLANIKDKLNSAESPDPKKFVPIEALQDLLKDRNQTAATMSETQAQVKVSEALKSGYITPAMKEWATALCKQDEASFDSFIEKSVPQFAHLFKPLLPNAVPPTDTYIQSDVADAVCSQLGLKKGTLKE